MKRTTQSSTYSEKTPPASIAAPMDPITAPGHMSNAELVARIQALFGPERIGDERERTVESHIDSIYQAFVTRRQVTSSFDMPERTPYYTQRSIPENGMNPQDYLSFLESQIMPHAVNTANPRCIGQMTTVVPHLLRQLAKLSIGINQNMVRVETSKSLTPLERKVLAMMHRTLYCFADSFYEAHAQSGESSLGIMTSGGTNANIISLWIGRNTALGGGTRDDRVEEGLGCRSH